MGKTRLAIEVASELDAGFDTVAFVPLASVGDPELVVASIARAVGLQSTDEATATALAAYLRPRTMLLILATVTDLGASRELDHVSFGCANRDQLEQWQARLEDLGIKHGGIAEDANGCALSFRDPDDIALELWAPCS